ncbi:hypothetical protein [Sulfurimonas diazotrophicus]|uniref:Uncharacterized protein n=1 Tax=Sulfurimonas diazotrophicus TaxID=3131939 RepID=A0ABZ3HD51_9BACT
MLIFGHPHLASDPFYHIDSPEAIATTPAGSTVLFAWGIANLDLVSYCNANDIPFALEAGSVKEALFAENAGARFILVESALAPSVQKVAETYLFDAKVLAYIEDETQIEAMAFEGIDGVVFAEAVIKVTG